MAKISFDLRSSTLRAGLTKALSPLIAINLCLNGQLCPTIGGRHGLAVKRLGESCPKAQF